MADENKTEHLEIVNVETSQIAEVLRKICREVQDRMYGEMTLPTDPHDRMLTLNTTHDVFDRLDEAIEAYIKNTKESVCISASCFDLKGDDHE